MNKEEMLAAREDIIEACLIQRKTITKRDKEEVIEKGPCNKIDGKKCAAYMLPAAKWKLGDCGLASHLINLEDEKKFVNPIKQSKRTGR